MDLGVLISSVYVLKELTAQSSGCFQVLCSTGSSKLPWLSGRFEAPLSFTPPRKGGKVDIRVVLWG